jgi:predicted alpha-1,2-mannosidase
MIAAFKKFAGVCAPFIFSLTLTHAQNLTTYVDPFIGTGGHGHTYPGATVPFGMVQLSPDNGSEGWDWCSGYNYIDSTIAGFSHTHLSGTGVGDWVDISVMPNTSLIDDAVTYFKTRFSHKNEKASPGFYSVKLDNGIKVSLTTTERCGMHQYEFPAGCNPVLRFQLSYMINFDEPTSTRIHLENDSTIVGYRASKGWAKSQKIYFAARTSKRIGKLHVYNNRNHKEVNEEDENGHVYNGEVEFKDLGGKPLLMKVALSSVSKEAALVALSEIKGWNFEQVKKEASAKWERELEKMQVKTTNEKLKRIFYTALYHTCLAPVTYSDADGRYRNEKDELKQMSKGQRYTVFSLWDTFRGLNPLLTLTQPERNVDILNSMLAFYDETGLLPVWELSTNETNCMSGYHSVPVLADAILKNTAGVDAEKAFAAMKASAFQKIRGTKDYVEYGYVPQNKHKYSVTKTLEYAFDDWCIAQVAKKLGKTDDYTLFMRRSSAYKLLFDKSTGFIRGKNTNGKWTEPFDPYTATTDGKKAMYEEGNAWQYTFFVPHDIRGLAGMYGSNEQFIGMLDSLFIADPPNIRWNESTPPDVSGLIGQYAHGNEPSHHIAYMYSFVGAPWKTQERVRYILDSMYHDRPDGYAGNEDCGQMSAWAVWSMAGFYPANPASGEYVFGSPVFDEISVKLPGNNQMIVKAKHNSKSHPYIQSTSLNGKPYTRTFIDHATLLKGGTLEFVMGDKPNKKWGADRQDRPSSASE